MEAGSCNPVGSKTSRGGEANGPAAVYAIAKWDEWLREYAPPGAASYDFYQSLPALSQGNVAQQIFWYTAFLADMVKPQSEGNNTVDADGNPLWRAAPSPHGPYWKDGQKVGYQDVGSWTILRSTPDDRAKAAWLYAQFVTSKTVDTKKSHVGLTFARDSTIRDESFTERAPKLGGVVEFYRSPDRVRWSPTGINVPDYPRLAQILVAADRQRELRLGDAAGGDGRARHRDGRHDGPHAAGRRGVRRLRRLRPAAERRGRPGRVARQARRAEGQAREREAAGRDHQLRRDGQGLGRGLQLTESAAAGRAPAAALPCRERTAMTLELRAVSKRVGADIHIHETNLTLATEGFNVLLGATGAGKTTLIKLMAGLEQPTSGEVWFRGRNVTGVIPRKRNVSLVHQFFINYPTMTVFENIASPLRVSGVARAEIERRVRETADLLHLTPMLGRRPQELSGGQQQRTALARAIVKSSDLVLLDEPLANLDYKLREELRDQLPALFAGRGAIVVYATSEPSEALMLGGHTATLDAGRVTQFGPTQECYRAPVDLTTARVFSDPPINAAQVDEAGRRDRPPRPRPLAGRRCRRRDARRRLHARAPAALRLAAAQRPGPGAAPGRRPDHRALGLRERRPLRRRRLDLGRAVERRPSVPGRRHPRLLPRRPPRPLLRRRRPEGRLMARIGLKDLRHSYTAHPRGPDDYALKQIDLDWQDGGAYALLGPSGCGKSTLLNIISGLIVPSEGRILFDDRDVTRLAPTERNIAQVFQFPVIYDTMTVYDNLAFPLRNRGVAPAAVDARVRTIAEMLELDAMLDRRAAGLTADGKQKISMGRGLVREDVNVIMFDEPLTVIDPHLKWKLRSKLKELHQALRVTMIYVTHDQTEALTFADQVVVMQEGEVVQIGSPVDLFERPAHTFVGHFIGSPGMNILPCRIEDGTAIFAGRRIATANRAAGAGAGRPEIGVRPEFVSLGADGIPAEIVRIADVGRHRVVQAEAGGQRINALLPEDAPVALGPAHLAFAPAQTRIYEDGWLAGGRR